MTRFVLPLLLLLGSIAIGPGGIQAGAPAQPPPCAAPPNGTTSPRVERIPIEVLNNHVHVKVCVRERSWTFLLDTGAGATFFDLGLARDAGVGIGAPFRARGGGAGTAEGAALRGVSGRLDGSTVEVPVPSAIDFSMLTPRTGRRVEGVLGFDFIRRYVVEIDYVGRELRLHPRDGFTYRGRGTAVPVTFVGNHPHADGAIRLADGTLLPARFVIDVGSSLALAMAQPFVDANRLRSRAGPVQRRRAGGGVGGATYADVGRVDALSIGGVEVRAPIVHLFGEGAGVFSGNPRWDGNIGGDILRRFTVWLDYDRSRLILEPHAGTTEPFETDMSGATFVGSADGLRLVVEEVVPGSPAAESGLAVDDVVLSIDGTPAQTAHLAGLRDRLRRPGEIVTIEIRRGYATRTVRLVTRRLI
jgi:hypothetical protein